MGSTQAERSCVELLTDLGFKDEVGLRRQSDDFSGHETQLLVLVQHRVHALDPLGVDRAVEDQPLPV